VGDGSGAVATTANPDRPTAAKIGIADLPDFAATGWPAGHSSHIAAHSASGTSAPHRGTAATALLMLQRDKLYIPAVYSSARASP